MTFRDPGFNLAIFGKTGQDLGRLWQDFSAPEIRQERPGGISGAVEFCQSLAKSRPISPR